MSDAKSKARELLDGLPEDCSLDEILYHLYVLRQVERGQADAQAGRVLPQEQVEQQLREKWQVGRAG